MKPACLPPKHWGGWGFLEIKYSGIRNLFQAVGPVLRNQGTRLAYARINNICSKNLDLVIEVRVYTYQEHLGK